MNLKRLKLAIKKKPRMVNVIKSQNMKRRAKPKKQKKITIQNKKQLNRKLK